MSVSCTGGLRYEPKTIDPAAEWPALSRLWWPGCARRELVPLRDLRLYAQALSSVQGTWDIFVMTEASALVRSFVDRLNAERRETHAAAIKLIEDLTDAELRWRPGPHAPSIGFHVWHLARWADKDAAEIVGTRQIWDARDLRRTWNLPEALGDSDTGTGMDDDVSTALALPGKTMIMEYAAAAFAALDAATTALSAALIDGTQIPRGIGVDKAVSYLFEYPTHDNRHLGMIEALRGQLRDSGTATR